MAGAEPRGTMHLLVRARARLCAVPLEKVLEVTRPLPLEPLPKMPSFVLGLTCIRGDDLPVIDLGGLLALDGERRPTRFVVAANGPRCLVLAVEGTHSIEPLDSARLRELPSVAQEVDRSLIGWIGRKDNELVMLLEAARLIDVGLSEVRGGG